MRLMLYALTMTLAGGGGSALSQSSSAAPSPTSSVPAESIRALTAALAGTWATREQYEAVGPTPAPGSGTGTVVWRPGPGGFTLLEEYRARTPLGELVGFGIIWWDTTRQLQHLWCINVNPEGCEMFPAASRPGPRWNGKQLVIDTEVSIGGKTYKWHEEIAVTSATSFLQSVDLSDSPGPLKRWLTSEATKLTAQWHPIHP